MRTKRHMDWEAVAQTGLVPHSEDNEAQKKREQESYMKNRAAIRARRSVRVACDCGGCYTLYNKAAHEKTERHAAFEALKKTD